MVAAFEVHLLESREALINDHVQPVGVAHGGIAPRSQSGNSLPLSCSEASATGRPSHAWSLSRLR